jgi:WD40 repeat protein
MNTFRFLAIHGLILSLITAPCAQAQEKRILVPVEEKPAQAATVTGARAQKPQLVLQTGLTEPPAKAAFSPDGTLLAAMGTFGGSVRLWDVANGRELLALKPRDGSQGLMQTSGDFIFHPDGRTLSTFAGGTLRQWEVATGAMKREAAFFDGREYGWSQFSPDGRWLATYGSETRELRIWDVAAGALVKSHSYQFGTGTGDDKYINLNAVGFSPDSRLIAISEDNQEMMSHGAEIVVRDVASWKPTQTIVLQAAVSAREQQQAMMKNSREALEALRKANTSARTAATEQTTTLFSRALKFTPDGRTLALLKRDMLQRYSMRTTESTYNQGVAVELFDVASGRNTGSFAVSPATDKTNPRDFMAQLAHSIAFHGRQCLVAENNANVKLVDLNGGRTLATLAGVGETIAAAFSADGRRAAVSEMDGTIRIWNLANAAATGRADVIAVFSSPAMGVSDVRFNAGGKSLVVASNDAVSAWELGAGTASRTVSLQRPKAKSYSDFTEQFSSAGLSGDGTLYFSRNQNTLKVFDARTGAETRSLPIKLRATYGNKVALSRNGNRMAFATGFDPAARAAQPAAPSSTASQSSMPPKEDKKSRPKEQKQPDLKDIMRISKETQKISEEYRKAMENGETAKANQLMEQLQALTMQIMEASGQDTSQYAAMVGNQSSQNSAAGLTPQIPREEVKVMDLGAGRELATIQGKGMMEVMAQAMAISPDGRWVATAFSAAKIVLADAQSGREVASITVDRGIISQAMAFSPDGKYLASLNMETRPGVNQTETNISMSQRYQSTLRIWDVSDPLQGAKGARSLQVISVTEQFPTIAFSNDGRRVAVLSNNVKLYDVATGREVLKLSGHNLPASSIAFSEDGRLIVTGSEDGSARLWDAQSGELMATLVHVNGGADWLVVTPDGLFDGTPGAWNQILWRFSQNIFDVTPVEVYFSDFFYPGLLAELYAGNAPRAARDVTQKDRRQPQVTLSVVEGQSGAARNLKLKIEVSEPAAGVGARDLRLFRNGTLVKAWRGDLLKGQPRATLEAQLPIVAGENRITAYAFNRDNIKSADATAMVTGAESLRRKGVAYVLAFGVNQYANAQYNLKYAVADANSFADEVRAQQTKLQQYERVEIVPLVDREATKANILLALRRLSNAATPLPAGAPAALAKLQPTQPEDAVVLYFAGHGTAQGKRFYLVPHDLGYAGARDQLSPMAVQMILARSISDLELESALETVDASQLLFVLDACNSGQALEADEKRRGPMNSSGLAQLAYEKGMYILTAAQSYQVALEAAQLGHGYLTFALVEEGLKKGMADRDLKDGQVLAREWFNYAAERVPQMQQQNNGTRLLLEEETKKASGGRTVQRPRVFFRRELETRPLVVARP